MIEEAETAEQEYKPELETGETGAVSFLGHTKNTTKSNVETAAKRGERVRIREQKRSSEAACNDREDEIASKRKKLNEPGIQVEEVVIQALIGQF